MKTMQKVAFVMLFAVVALIGLNGTSHADLEMKIWDSEGDTPLLLTDSGTGLIVKIGGSLGSWTFAQNVAVGSPVVGSPSQPQFDLNFDVIDGNVGSSQWLKIAVSETGFTTGPGITKVVSLAAGGTLGSGSVTVQDFLDPTNTIFGGITGLAISVLGPYTGSAWSSGANGFFVGGTYSLTVLYTLTSNESGVRSGGDVDILVNPVPLPGALLLFAPGMLVLVRARRKLTK